MTAHQWVEAVQARCPDERVISGPFMVCHASELARNDEKAMAVRALLTVRQEHPKARIVVWRERAFVLRPVEGWLYQGKEGVAKPMKAKARKGGTRQ